jgi:hypothetical protein
MEAHNPVIFHIALILLGGEPPDSVTDVPLEVEFQCKLQNSWVHDCGQDLSEGRRRKICVWVCELRRIERIEKLRSKLDIRSLFEPRHRRAFDQGYVKIRFGRAVYNADAAIPKRSSHPIITDDWEVWRKAAFVEVVV